MGKVIAICTSKHKGTLKNEVAEANLIEEFGIEGDAHAGKWHRQVSLLALENLVIEGFELNKLPVGQRLTIGEDILLEVTQIGKECHDKCAIYYQVGECIMPKNGIFTRVLKGGKVKVGDECNLVDSGKKILSL